MQEKTTDELLCELREALNDPTAQARGDLLKQLIPLLLALLQKFFLGVQP